MKIGIFGDSHGDVSYLEWKKLAPQVGPGWPEHLTKFHKVTNYCEGGSGLWYSFKKFRDFHVKFDKCIFLPSQPARFTVHRPEHGEPLHIVPGYVGGDAIRQLKSSSTLLDNAVFEAAAGYIEHILDYDKEHLFGQYLIKEIHAIRPDTLIVKTFDQLHPESTNDSCSLSWLSQLDIKGWGFNDGIRELRAYNKNLVDYRKCHLTDENNEMVFNKIFHAIKNNLTYLDFKNTDYVPPSKPMSHYIYEVDGRPGNV